MNPKVMICGVDCRQGDANCNGYCTGKADSPPAATLAQTLASMSAIAHRATGAAEKAWYEYAAMIEVGPERTHAFQVYENLRLARRP